MLLGVCGSSAAGAGDQLVEQAARHASRIDVVVTTAALRFLPPLPHDVRVFSDADWTGRPDDPLHLRLLEGADLFLIAPVTATTLARCATGMADTLLSALVLAHGPGVHFAPSMNTRMWTSPPTARNTAVLRADGHHVLEPEPADSLTDSTVGSGVGGIPGRTLDRVILHLDSRRS
ncbi:flavoprotein [Streptomyces niveus]|uniref:flavoprotein n=1 Tax=Streptomyces niveus TaxID=193462 RepID=UPI0036A8C730